MNTVAMVTICEMDSEQEFRSGMKDEKIYPDWFAVTHGFLVPLPTNHQSGTY